ncbi:MAG: adenylate/guanylate cyclase domain-containing protein [Prochlorothrix sp.]|nr:adenylate/guanylate cyclase domain-containing protein [Prochlorothrix sp.]
MTSSAPKPLRDADSSASVTIDVTPVIETQTVPASPSSSGLATRPAQSSGGGGLATTKGNFSAFLAPLTQETFKEVVTDVEQKLKVVNQTLSMLELDTQSFEAILQEMLDAITLKTRELLGADRATIFLLDEDKNQLWSIVAEGDDGTPLELRIPADKGIAGEVATFKKVINIPYDFYDDPRSAFAQIQDKKNNYRTYSMLTLPLLSEAGDLVAVVQLINKLKANATQEMALADRIDTIGFLPEDEVVFDEFSPSIRLILESSRSFYVATQKQRAASALMDAIQSLSKSSLDLADTLKQVMDEAKKLMHADRSTLWLVDDESRELWTKIAIVNGEEKEIRIPIGVGFAGRVAQEGEPLIIGFDLYNDPEATTAKETDKKTGYRTCSLLCMPVFNADNKLIGVTQLINKKKQGDFPPYDPSTWPEAPECWKASFDRTDMEFMHAFNIQAGVALQNAKLFATVKQQEQMQRDILRSLSNAVISTDKEGRIIAANESARAILGRDADERLEDLDVRDLVTIKEGDFSKWLDAALSGQNEKDRQQYYPDQTLQSNPEGTEEHSVHLSINSIANAADRTDVYGALVVMDDISDEKRLKSTMYRYMTQELAEELLRLGDTKLGGDRKEVSVLFSDIRGYTTLTESMEAEEVVGMLNEYFESMVDAVFQYKGTLDKYIGDAIMAVFGSPLPLEDHAWMSVQTAIEMRHRLARFNEKRATTRHQPIRIGIGINSDSVISGNIGSSKRMEFTAIGDGVNLGSRLEGASKQYGCDIVISESTYTPCAHKVWARELDYIKVKGKTQPVSVYELIGIQEGTLADPISDEQKQVIDYYAKGREYYLQRKFPLAMGQFGQVLEIFHDDKASALHLERCNHWLQNPPPDDWDGSWQMTSK